MRMDEFVASVYGEMPGVSDQEVTLAQVLRATRDEEAALLVDIESSGDPGELLSTPVNVDSGTDTYTVLVAPERFGRSVIAEAEIPSTNGGRRRVAIVDFKESDILTGSANWPSTVLAEGTSYRPERLALYRTPTEIKVRVGPWPNGPITYHIWYTSGSVGLLQLGNVPRLAKAAPHFVNLLLVNVVLRLLPHARSLGPDYRGEIRATLSQRRDDPINGLYRLWHQWRTNPDGETDGPVDGFSLGDHMGGWIL
jgi:hypothetical protein